MFAAIAVLTAVVGVFFNGLGESPPRNSTATGIGYFEILTSDPGASVDAYEQIRTGAFNPAASADKAFRAAFNADTTVSICLGITPSPGVTRVEWAVLASGSNGPGPNPPASYPAETGINVDYVDYQISTGVVDTTDLRSRSGDATSAGACASGPPSRQVAAYTSFPKIISTDSGSLRAHIPSIAPRSGAGLALVQDGRTGAPLGVAGDLPQQKTEPTTPSARSEVVVDLVTPARTQITADLSNGVSLIEGLTIESMVPSDPAYLGRDLMWKGTDQLAIGISASDPDADDRRSAYNFYSGISFGVAGSAALAILQERPERPVNRRLRAGGRASPSVVRRPVPPWRKAATTSGPRRRAGLPRWARPPLEPLIVLAGLPVAALVLVVLALLLSAAHTERLPGPIDRAMYIAAWIVIIGSWVTTSRHLRKRLRRKAQLRDATRRRRPRG